MSLIEDVKAMAEEHENNPVVVKLNIRVRDEDKKLEVRKNSDHEEVVKRFIRENHLNKKSLEPIMAKITSLLEKSNKSDDEDNRGRTKPPAKAALKVNIGNGKSEEIIITEDDEDMSAVVESFIEKHKLARSTSNVLVPKLENLKKALSVQSMASSEDNYESNEEKVSLQNAAHEVDNRKNINENATDQNVQSQPAPERKKSGLFHSLSKRMGLVKAKSNDNLKPSSTGVEKMRNEVNFSTLNDNKESSRSNDMTKTEVMDNDMLPIATNLSPVKSLHMPRSNFSPYKDKDRGTPGTVEIGSLGRSVETSLVTTPGSLPLHAGQSETTRSRDFDRNRFLASVNVKISADKTVELQVYDGDDADQLAVAFVKRYNLPQKVTSILVRQVSNILHTHSSKGIVENGKLRDSLSSESASVAKSHSSNALNSGSSSKEEQTRGQKNTKAKTYVRDGDNMKSMTSHISPDTSTRKFENIPSGQSTAKSPRSNVFDRSKKAWGLEEEGTTSRTINQENLTPRNIRDECRRLFKIIDSNGDNRISKIELIKGLRHGDNTSLRKLFNLPDHVRQEDGSRDAFMKVWHSMDMNESQDITEDEFVSFCLELHGFSSQATNEKGKEAELSSSSTPISRPNNHRTPVAGNTQAIVINQPSISRSRSLSPAQRRSVSRMYSAAEMYNKKKDKRKKELLKEEEEYLHSTKDKWRNDMIRYRITGTPTHRLTRSKSAPRSGSKVGQDLYEKDMKWLKRRDKSVDGMRKQIQLEKDKSVEALTFKPKLVTEEFNALNHVTSTLNYRPQVKQHDDSVGFNIGEHMFKPKINAKSERLARKRREERELDEGIHVCLSPNKNDGQTKHISQENDQENSPNPNIEAEWSSDLSKSKRNKSPSLFEQLYQDAERHRKKKDKSIEKYSINFSFKPDIGHAKYRRVEQDQEQFVNRLHNHREKQDGNIERLRREVQEKDNPRQKVLQSKDVKLLTERLCFAAKKLQEKKKSKCMQEERKMMEQASTKHTTNRSNRLTGAARRKSLEEIFEVLLMSAEMSRDMTRQKNISTGNVEKGGEQPVSWGISKVSGEESYEITPAPTTQSPELVPERIRSLKDDEVSSVSVVDSHNSENLNIRQVFDEEGEDDFQTASSEDEDPLVSSQKNLLHNFLASDISTSTTESSVLQRLNQNQDKADDLPDTLPKNDNQIINLQHHRVDDSISRPVDNANSTVVEKYEIRDIKDGVNGDESQLLDTKFAIPEMLKPKALAEAAAMVIHASKPHFLSKNDFIECFEVLMSSGITAPVNALLSVPQAPKPIAKKVEEEVLPYPQLHNGPKSKKLRDKVSHDSRRKGQTSSDKLRYRYHEIYAKKSEERRQHIKDEKEKDITFQPVIFTKNHRRRSTKPKLSSTPEKS